MKSLANYYAKKMRSGSSTNIIYEVKMSLIDRIVGMFTLEFFVGSVIFAILVNMISSYIYKIAMEESPEFRDRNIDKVKRSFFLLKGLHGNTQKILCFSFKGIGMSVALISITLMILSIQNIMFSYSAIQVSTSGNPKQPPCVLEEMKTRKNPSPECSEEMRKAYEYAWTNAEKQRISFAEHSKKSLILYFLAFTTGAISMLHAMNTYKTLKMVENFKNIESQYKNITETDT